MNKIADSPIQTVISAGKMEDFFTMLKEFDSIKTSDCLIRNNMSIDVHITRKKGKLGNWVVTEDLSLWAITARSIPISFSSPEK